MGGNLHVSYLQTFFVVQLCGNRKQFSVTLVSEHDISFPVCKRKYVHTEINPTFVTIEEHCTFAGK